MVTTLPQELVDTVVDHFDGDVESLKVISLVSPPFLTSARAHIFRKVHLHPPSSAQLKPVGARPSSNKQTSHIPLSDSLLALIRQTPVIAANIRDLTITEGILQREWLAASRSLPLLLQQLTGLNALSLERSASMRLVWKDLPPALQGVLERGFSLETLSKISITGLVMRTPRELWDLVFGRQGGSVGLKSLALTHIDFAGPGSLGDGGDAKYLGTNLNTLIIGARSSIRVVDSLLHMCDISVFSLGNLKRLQISISRNFPSFAALLHEIPNLEHLEVTLMNDINLEYYASLPPSKQLSLAPLPLLRTLTIKMDIIQRQDDPFPFLKSLFSTLFPTPPSPPDSSPSSSPVPTYTTGPPLLLEEINILYTLYLPSPYMDRSFHGSVMHGWDAIDATLGAGLVTDSESITAPSGGGGGYGGGSLAQDTNPSKGTATAITTKPRLAALHSVNLTFALENPIGFGIAPRFLRELEFDSWALGRRGVDDEFDEADSDVNEGGKKNPYEWRTGRGLLVVKAYDTSG